MPDRYENFQLQWMLDHGFSLDDLIRELDETRKNMAPQSSISNIFRVWQADSGFGGSIWPCREEWEACEECLTNENLTERKE